MALESVQGHSRAQIPQLERLVIRGCRNMVLGRRVPRHSRNPVRMGRIQLLALHTSTKDPVSMDTHSSKSKSTQFAAQMPTLTGHRVLWVSGEFALFGDKAAAHRLPADRCSWVPYMQRTLRTAERNKLTALGFCCHTVHRLAAIEGVHIHCRFSIPTSHLLCTKP